VTGLAKPSNLKTDKSDRFGGDRVRRRRRRMSLRLRIQAQRPPTRGRVGRRDAGWAA
jgi:hypothetical protein